MQVLIEFFKRQGENSVLHILQLDKPSAPNSQSSSPSQDSANSQSYNSLAHSNFSLLAVKWGDAMHALDTLMSVLFLGDTFAISVLFTMTFTKH